MKCAHSFALWMALLCPAATPAPRTQSDLQPPRSVPVAPRGVDPAAVPDVGAVLGILMTAKQLIAPHLDLRVLANNIHHLASINVWPMWACTYADGTVVYNKFRWYRDAAVVTSYFVGLPGSHDCDSYYDQGGRRYRWCTQNAAAFALQHGGIVDIRPIE